MTSHRPGGPGSPPVGKRKQNNPERACTCDPRVPRTERLPPASARQFHSLVPRGQRQETPPPPAVRGSGVARLGPQGLPRASRAELAKPTLQERPPFPASLGVCTSRTHTDTHTHTPDCRGARRPPPMQGKQKGSSPQTEHRKGLPSCQRLAQDSQKQRAGSTGQRAQDSNPGPAASAA